MWEAARQLCRTAAADTRSWQLRGEAGEAPLAVRGGRGLCVACAWPRRAGGLEGAGQWPQGASRPGAVPESLPGRQPPSFTSSVSSPFSLLFAFAHSAHGELTGACCSACVSRPKPQGRAAPRHDPVLSESLGEGTRPLPDLRLRNCPFHFKRLL